jgi:HEPN domain-containing protein
MKEGSSNPSDWFAKADADLRAAELVLEDEEALSEIACYHAQQCAEKYLKGYLVSRGVTFKLVHELAYLVRLSSECDGDFESLLGLAAELEDYASDVRYPIDGVLPPTHEDAQEAIRRAKAIREFVLSRMDR